MENYKCLLLEISRAFKQVYKITYDTKENHILDLEINILRDYEMDKSKCLAFLILTVKSKYKDFLKRLKKNNIHTEVFKTKERFSSEKYLKYYCRNFKRIKKINFTKETINEKLSLNFKGKKIRRYFFNRQILNKYINTRQEKK